jgi:hypothetical protein
VFDIPVSERPKLGEAEDWAGGYNARSIPAMTPTGKYLETTRYLADATAMVKDRAPYSWCREFVEGGGRAWPAGRLCRSSNTRHKIGSGSKSENASAKNARRFTIDLVSRSVVGWGWSNLWGTFLSDQ